MHARNEATRMPAEKAAEEPKADKEAEPAAEEQRRLLRINPEKLRAMLLRKINEYQNRIYKNIEDLQELAKKERESGKKDPEAFKSMFSNLKNIVENDK